MTEPRYREVVVATVLPFTDSGAVDWQGYERLLAYCALPEGISTVFVNGHAGEGATLSLEERKEVIRRTRRFLEGTGKGVISGIITYGTEDAIRESEAALEAGAEGVVLFPLPQFGGAVQQRPDMALAYVEAVCRAVDAPVGIFQYPIASGFGYTTATLKAMAEIPGVAMIKDGSDSIMAYEDNLRTVKAAAPHVAMMPTSFNFFLAQMAHGGDGILSGLASLTPHLLVDLWRATRAGDLAGMRRAGDQLHPIVRGIYAAPPAVDCHTRIKVVLHAMGLIASDHPRPPLLPVSREVAEEVVRVAEAGGLRARLDAARAHA